MTGVVKKVLKENMNKRETQIILVKFKSWGGGEGLSMCLLLSVTGPEKGQTEKGAECLG